MGAAVNAHHEDELIVQPTYALSIATLTHQYDPPTYSTRTLPVSIQHIAVFGSHATHLSEHAHHHGLSERAPRPEA